MDSQRERLLTVLPALLRELAESGVTELEVSYGETSLYLKQRPGAPPPLEGDAAPATGEAQLEEGLVPIAAPLAGVFYGAASPDEPPFVSEGEAVEVGQVVALVEAMKVFNEIHAEVSGVVVAILVGNGQTVLAGQTLITIRPDEGGGAAPELAEPAEPAEPA
jgi:acetyl-CoA carboxylase biotin carboxyl carrier protein